eukprot:TRINITY_DN7910_c0_g1_i2.p1 TRINITY_DN7910_c0_g1~~TRINITY_DN7910_c0_g1_i2.p1  ORF type:complete len:396 (+),score=81.63 TRINITY_DN7910_c0_g1_i2:24-1190(+)
MAEVDPKKSKKLTRVYADGCFDLMHFGHANALRQAKSKGDVLVVGIHTDEDIARNKGPPVLTLEERAEMVSAVKWVDEVVTDAPYTFSVEYMDKHNCDFVCHGDDISTNALGEDAYGAAKKAGRYKEYQRTQGVSTTDIVGRMLLMTKSHHSETSDKPHSARTSTADGDDGTEVSPYTGKSPLLATSKRIVQFSNQAEPAPGAVVGYIPGAFDLFHAGHIRALKAAKQQCDYLIVGLHTDAIVNKNHGSNYPILNLHERTLSVLACKFVDDVIIGAPEAVTEELLDYFKVDKVFHGSTEILQPGDTDPYAVAKKRGVFTRIDSTSSLTTEIIVQRIITNRGGGKGARCAENGLRTVVVNAPYCGCRLKFAERNAKKNKREVERISNEA